MILKSVTEGQSADVVIAPPAVLDSLAKAGKLDAASRAPVGRVGIGVVIRSGAPVPDISTTDALKQSVALALLQTSAARCNATLVIATHDSRVSTVFKAQKTLVLNKK